MPTPTAAVPLALLPCPSSAHRHRTNSACLPPTDVGLQDGSTALHKAATAGAMSGHDVAVQKLQYFPELHINVAALLVGNGADPDLRDAVRCTATPTYPSPPLGHLPSLHPRPP